MKRCERCGREYPDSTVFCGNCGNQMGNQTNSQTNNQPQNFGNNQGGNYGVYTDGTNPYGVAPNGGGMGSVPPKNGNNVLIPALVAGISVLVVVSIVLLIKVLTGGSGDDRRLIDDSAVTLTAEPNEDVTDTSDSNMTSRKQHVPQATPIPKPTPQPTPVPQKRYEVYRGDVTWHDANQYAFNKGGHLVCINNGQEFSKVCSLADAKGIKVFWVGVKRNYYDSWSDSYWNDGTKMTYTNWLPGEPTYISEQGDDEYYLMVSKVDGNWYYNDAVNDVSQYYPGKIGYIVEWED